jgi:hypothetical protein
MRNKLVASQQFLTTNNTKATKGSEIYLHFVIFVASVENLSADR